MGQGEKFWPSFLADSICVFAIFGEHYRHVRPMIYAVNGEIFE